MSKYHLRKIRKKIERQRGIPKSFLKTLVGVAPMNSPTGTIFCLNKI